MEECKACGKCCQNHWLVQLFGETELKRFKKHLVYEKFIWTDLCPYLKNGKCNIHDIKPYRCRQYFCEGKEP